MLSDRRTGCSHVPERFSDDFLDSFDPSVGPAAEKALEATRRFIAGDAFGLLLSGPVGCGKSMLGAIVANEMAQPAWDRYFEADDRVRSVEQQLAEKVDVGDWQGFDRAFTPEQLEAAKAAYARRDGLGRELGDADRTRRSAWRSLELECPRWVSVPRLISGLQREMGMKRTDRDEVDRPANHTVADAAGEGNVIVVDDLGSEKLGDWAFQVIFDLVASRYDDGGGVIVTTNKTVAQLNASGYGRIVSRLADEGIVLEMRTAKDYRQRRRVSVA